MGSVFHPTNNINHIGHTQPCPNSTAFILLQRGWSWVPVYLRTHWEGSLGVSSTVWGIMRRKGFGQGDRRQLNIDIDIVWAQCVAPQVEAGQRGCDLEQHNGSQDMSGLLTSECGVLLQKSRHARRNHHHERGLCGGLTSNPQPQHGMCGVALRSSRGLQHNATDGAAHGGEPHAAILER